MASQVLPEESPHSTITKLRDRMVKSVEVSRNLVKEESDISTDSESETLLVKVTDWVKERPHMSYDFFEDPTKTMTIVQFPDLAAPESQENLLLDDLISCFLGFNGQLIYPNPLNSPYGMRTFTISDQVDPKLKDLCFKTLTLASSYSLVVRFIQNNKQLDSGRVNQALSAAMDKMLINYMDFIVRLEQDICKKALNLHSLWFQIQPASHTMDVLSSIVTSMTTSTATGGATLSILHNMAVALVSDSNDQEMLAFLTSRAAVPFLESVQKWIFQGVIFDPYDEFMILGNPRLQASKDQYSDEYWVKRYQIRKQFVPSFLEKVKDKVLDCGKYLNVIRECTSSGDILDLKNEEEVLKYNLTGTQYLATIDKAYRFASTRLLDILINQFKVIDRIKSVKRYMLLQQGDFVVQVLDTCEDDLLKPISEVVPSRLSALLEMAIRIPSTNDDIYRDDIVLCLKPQDLSTQIFDILSITSEDGRDVKLHTQNTEITGFDAFTLDLECVWPVSLIFNHKIMLYYQMMFRHLMYCKYIERLLSRVWLWDKAMNLRSLGQSEGYIKAFSLRNKMIFCVQNIEYYMMDEVIEPNWIEFMDEVLQVENVDDLLKRHRAFLKKCIKDCMLTEPILLNIFRNLLAVCKSFTSFILNVEKKNEFENRTFSECVDHFGSEFEKYFLGLLKAIQELSVGDSDKLMNVIERQNFNFYFTTKLEEVDYHACLSSEISS